MKRMKKRPRWPYWARALRNHLIALALVATAWELMEMPLPSARLEFRRLEREALAPYSEIIAVIPTRDPFYPNIMIGLTDDWAMVGTPYSISARLSDSDIHPLDKGTNLICLRQSVDVPDQAGQPLFHAAYAALRPPEGSAGAALTLHTGDGDFSAEGVREGEIFLFYFRPEDVKVYNRLKSLSREEYTYELAFYDEAGTFIQEITG